MGVLIIWSVILWFVSPTFALLTFGLIVIATIGALIESGIRSLWSSVRKFGARS